MAITVAENLDRRLEVFITQDNQGWANVPLQHIWQTAPNNGWSGRDSRGGNVSGAVVTQNQDGRLEVFAIGLPTFNADGSLLHIWQTAANNGWSEWDSLGGSIGRLAVARSFRLPRATKAMGLARIRMAVLKSSALTTMEPCSTSGRPHRTMAGRDGTRLAGVTTSFGL